MEQNTRESAIVHIGIADFYAETLGTYPHHKFLSQIQASLRDLQPFFEGEGSALLAHPLRLIKEEHLGQPIEQQALQGRIRKLLNTPIARTSSILSANPVDTPDVTSPQEEEDTFCLQVRQVIEKHLQEYDYSIQDLCRELGMSHSHLHRRLSAANGQSITKFIRSIRLQKAKELLLDPDLTVAAIENTGIKLDPTLQKEYVAFKDPDRISWEFYSI